jgi:hypothetical protein
LAGDYTSQPGGSDAAGNPVDNVTGAFGAGIKTKFNWKRPSEWVLFQVVGRASVAALSQDVSNALLGTLDQTTRTFNLFLGLGFEAFVPKWEALSVEASAGLSISSIQTKTSDGVAQSGSSASLVGDGFSPLNLALHVYF